VEQEESRAVVVVGIVANLLIAVSKLGAGALGHSASLIAEGLHSTVDTVNSVLLLVGQKRSKLPPDAQHPFGHGKELYFWTLTMSLMMFAISGGVAIFRGIHEILQPEPLQDPKWNYIVIAVASAIAGFSALFAYRKFRKTHPGKGGFFKAVEQAKDPLAFMVFFEDAAELVGLGIAAVAIYLAHALNKPWIDGMGSVAIGVLLAVMAVLLANESRKLLIGERVDAALSECVKKLVAEHSVVQRVHHLRTMHFGPKQVLIAMNVELDPKLSTADAADAIEQLRERLKREHPEIHYLYLQLCPVSR
jgi:cation diffusion facilitator family transporter